MGPVSTWVECDGLNGAFGDAFTEAQKLGGGGEFADGVGGGGWGEPAGHQHGVFDHVADSFGGLVVVLAVVV